MKALKEPSTRKRPKGSIQGQLEHLGLIDAFKQFCTAKSPGNAELSAWCLAKGVDPKYIPFSFKDIRRTLGVKAAHGGVRPSTGARGYRVNSWQH